MAKVRAIIKTEFKALCCPHCEQHGISSSFKAEVKKGEVVAFRCKACKSRWGANGEMTRAPLQSALRKLLK